MPDPTFLLRTAESGTPVKGTPGHVLAFDSTGEAVQGVPAASGISPPIQNVFFLDPAFVGASNGSIGAPFTTLAAFLAEVVSDTQGYKLTFPGTPFTIDEHVPDLNLSSAVVFEGLGRNATFVTGMGFANQTGAPSFELSEMTMVGNVPLGGGAVDFFLENMALEQLSIAGTLTGTVHLTNIEASGTIGLDSGGAAIRAENCILSGNVSCRGGSEFDNVTFGAGTTLTFGGTAPVRFTSCVFQGNTIDNGSNPTIELDPSSYYWFLASGVVFAGNIRLTPVTPVIGQVSLVGAAPIGGGTVSTLDFGDPTGGLPKAEAGSLITGCFASDPGNVAFELQGISVDAGTGHIIALIANNSAATHQPSNPLVLNIVYHPREQAL